MAEPGSVIPFSSSFLSSSDQTADRNDDSPSLPKPSPSITHHYRVSKKKRAGRPVGSKNKPRSTLVVDIAKKNIAKPIFIEVPENYDVIKTLVQFARNHHVSIIVLNASGTVSKVTLRHNHSQASSLTLYGPFKLISLSGTYINYTPFNTSSSISSTLNLDPYCSFNISFSGVQEQSFIGVVGGKVVAENGGVLVAATIVNNFEV